MLSRDFNLIFFLRILFSRGKKENKEMSRSAREAAKMRVDKVRLVPSIVVEDAQDLRIFFFYASLLSRSLCLLP